MTKSTKLLTIDWENLSLAGNDKALEESTFSYKDCCNDEAGILSMFKINVKFCILYSKVYLG